MQFFQSGILDILNSSAIKTKGLAPVYANPSAFSSYLAYKLNL